MSATSIDATLDWQVGDPEARVWRARQPYWAEHRDGDGVYIVTRTEARTVTVLGEHLDDPSVWRVSWHARSRDMDAVVMPLDLATHTDLELVKAAAAAHHAVGRRANAWARYMRENDPPEVTR
jgi:hypothetical protein